MKNCVHSADHRKAPAQRLWPLLALAWTGFLILAALVVSAQSTAFDHTALLFWRHADMSPLGPPWLTQAMRGLSHVGSTLGQVLIAVCGLAILLFARQYREAAGFTVTVCVSWIVLNTLKVLVARPRPPHDWHLAHAHGFSFPSGHSFNSALILLSIALALAPLLTGRNWRTALLLGAALLSASVAFTRVWLGVHWPSDALGGWLGGSALALTSAILVRRQRRTATA